MTGDLTPQETRDWTRVGVLVSLALVFGYLETFLAIPIPGVRLGLANVVVLVALDLLPLGQAGGIALLKVLVSGLLFGSPLTIAYASLGTLLSFAAMAVLVRTHRASVVATSVCGALLHTLGQLLVAEWLLGTNAIWAWAPLLCATSLAAGTLTGLVARSTIRTFSGEAPSESLLSDADLDTVAASVLAAPGAHTAPLPAALRLVVAFALTAALFQTRSLVVMGVLTALSATLALLARVPLRTLRRGLPLLALSLVTAALQLAMGQAAATALATVLRLVCPLLLYTTFARVTPLSELRGLIDAILAPLARRWQRARGLTLALSVALAFLPLQQRMLDQLRARDGRLSPALLASLTTTSLHCVDHLARQLADGKRAGDDGPGAGRQRLQRSGAS